MKNTIFMKSFETSNVEDYSELISKYAVDTDGLEVFKALAYNTDLDRDNEKAEESFLDELANCLIGKPVILNHDTSDVENTVGRIIKAEKIENKLYVWFYVADDTVKNKIKQGIYNGVSCNFKAKTKKVNNIVCFVGCEDAYEMSIVTVPAVSKASIIIKCMKGDMEMHNIFKMHKLFSKYPSLKSVEPEALEELTKVEDTEITEEDIENFIRENESLKAKIAELETKNAELEDELKTFKEVEEKQKEEDYVESEIKSALDNLDVEDNVKEVFVEDLIEEYKNGDLVVEETEGVKSVKGLDTAVDKITKKCLKLGLVKKTETIENTTEKSKSLSFSAVQNKVENESTENRTYTIKKGFK